MHRLYFLSKLVIVQIQLYNYLYTHIRVNVYVPNHVYGVFVYVHVEKTTLCVVLQVSFTFLCLKQGLSVTWDSLDSLEGWSVGSRDLSAQPPPQQ